ncbi:hypothetical protein RJ641_019422 [Dillenia turbinata]|uniref:Uncharacterized protein n=1 Tax=Dillenia turbinata TaxID=194707 RepID=A0AAN8YXC7_9MAGN
MVNPQVGQDDRTHGYFLDLPLSLSARTSKTPPPPSLPSLAARTPKTTPPPSLPPPPHEGPLSLQSNFLIPTGLPIYSPTTFSTFLYSYLQPGQPLVIATINGGSTTANGLRASHPSPPTKTTPTTGQKPNHPSTVSLGH